MSSVSDDADLTFPVQSLPDPVQQSPHAHLITPAPPATRAQKWALYIVVGVLVMSFVGGFIAFVIFDQERPN